MSLTSSTHTTTSPAVASTSADVKRRDIAVEMVSSHLRIKIQLTCLQQPSKRNTIGNIQAVEVNGTVQVIVNGLGWNNQAAVLDRQCLWALNFPVQV
jgi:hypothetical protein